VCEAFKKIIRLFENISKEMKALKKIWGFFKDYEVFEDIFNRIEAFLRWCFKEFEAFSNYFQMNGGFYSIILKDFGSFKYISEEVEAFV
jgi:hypothetical protein